MWRLARLVVESQFPDTLASDVLLQAGIDPELVLQAGVGAPVEGTRRRSAAWVAEVLAAWNRQCAFCGYDGQLGDAQVGLEAAHVRWFKLGGPDSPDNGLALCSLHHKLFDRGALGIDPGYRVKVSTDFVSRTLTGQAVFALHGVELRPRPGSELPLPGHVAWHDREVFKGRPLSA